jgi:putative hydrolase of the HAD superfamily
MKNDSEITTLFVDVGGVLLSNGWGHEFRQQAAEKFHLNIQEIEERHVIMFATYEEGNVNLKEYLRSIVFYQKRDFTMDEFRDFMFSLSTSFIDMIAFIEKLKTKYSLKIVAVSNEARELNAYRIQKFQLSSVVDFFISSCYVHLRKPDVNIFRMALDVAHVSAGQVIYIDDVRLFLDVATDLGIRGIHHKDYLSTVKELAAIGLSVE